MYGRKWILNYYFTEFHDLEVGKMYYRTLRGQSILQDIVRLMNWSALKRAEYVKKCTPRFGRKILENDISKTKKQIGIRQ